jgi:menaquinone-dependent protoporphyrinogen IX oxidase
MKTAVVYRSKTGFTKKYAHWIAAELDADLFRGSAVGVETLADYDIIIYGGGLYAGGIDGVKLITKNLGRLPAQKIVVFATGATPQREETTGKLERQNFTPEQLERVRFFYLRGGFDYSKLSPINKVIMNLLRWSLKRKKQLTADERGMLAAYDTPVDFTRKEKIQDLVSYCRETDN